MGNLWLILAQALVFAVLCSGQKESQFSITCAKNVCKKCAQDGRCQTIDKQAAADLIEGKERGESNDDAVDLLADLFDIKVGGKNPLEAFMDIFLPETQQKDKGLKVKVQDVWKTAGDYAHNASSSKFKTAQEATSKLQELVHKGSEMILHALGIEEEKQKEYGEKEAREDFRKLENNLREGMFPGVGDKIWYRFTNATNDLFKNDATPGGLEDMVNNFFKSNAAQLMQLFPDDESEEYFAEGEVAVKPIHPPTKPPVDLQQLLKLTAQD